MNGRKIANFGHDFEKRTLSAFVRNGYALVDKNQWRRNYDIVADEAIKREFDLILFNTYNYQFYIIECKAHLNKKNLVPTDHIRQFNHKINNYGGLSSVALLVTDTGFTRNAINFASKNDIKTMNGDQFMTFEKEGRFFRKARSATYSYAYRKIENLIDRLIKIYV